MFEYHSMRLNWGTLFQIFENFRRYPSIRPWNPSGPSGETHPTIRNLFAQAKIRNHGSSPATATTHGNKNVG